MSKDSGIHPPDTNLSSFKTLSPHARQVTYLSILDDLRLDERRLALDFLIAKSHFDIIANLPTELVIRVAQFLDLCHIHLVRRVSKRWNLLFTSSGVISHPAVLRNFYNTIPGTPLPANPSSPTWLRDLRCYAMRREAIVRARPYPLATDFPDYFENMTPTRCAYADGSFALCIRNAMAEIILFSLVDDDASAVFFTEDRDAFTHFRLSDSVLAAISTRG